MRHGGLNRTSRYNSRKSKGEGLTVDKVNKIIWFIQTIILPIATLYLKNKNNKRNKGLK